MPTMPPPSYRKAWKVWLYAIALAINLGVLGARIRVILGGGDIDIATIFSTVLCGVLAAFLFVEVRKPRDPGATPRT